ncbi:hypothetical protein CgunFtcFv8_026356 [Champsocephalus gunnari]|uniref:Uncharacterized protein n=1 Tax=Champsocephalus gunnari TaxID=52237 RepID=A0AAN8DWP4_CHAGU|nr:hypothetical protein CgunFtcFv8_026356 [Champsocephalus gunnari]
MGVQCDTVPLFSHKHIEVYRACFGPRGLLSPPNPLWRIKQRASCSAGGWGALGGGHAAVGLSKVTLGKSWLHICSQAWHPDPRPAVPGSCPPRCPALTGRGERPPGVRRGRGGKEVGE